MRRILMRVAKGVLVLLLICVIAVLIAAGLLFSPIGGRWVKGKLLEAANNSLEGTLQLDTLELAPGGRIHLRGVRLLDPSGHRVASADRVDAHVQLFELLRKRIRIRQLVLTQPHLEIHSDPNGQSNLSAAIASRAPPAPTKPSTPMSWTIELDDVSLVQGRVQMQAANAPPLQAEGLAISGSATLGPDTLESALVLTGQLEQPERAPLELRIAAHGTGLTPDGQLELDEVRLRAGSSTLEAHGQLARGQAGLEAEAHVSQKLAAAFGVPLGSDLSAQLQVAWKKGQPAHVMAAVPLDPGGIWLDADIWVQEQPLRYDAKLRLDRVNPEALVVGAPHGDLTGQLELAGHGTSLAELSLQVKSKLQPSRLRGIAINALTLRGAVKDEALTVEALHVDAPGGTLTGEGRASMKALASELKANVTDLHAFTQNLGLPEPYVGSATAALHLAGTPQVPSLQLELQAPRVANSRMELDVHELFVQATIANLRRPAQLRAHLRAARGHFQGEELVGFSGDVDLAGTRYHVNLTSAGPTGLTVHAVGLLPDQQEVMTLNELELARGDWRWILQKPTTIDVSHGAVARRLVLRAGNQELVLQGGLAHRRFDLHAAITALDLSQLPALVVPPDLGLHGQLSGTAQIRGPITAPTVETHLRADGVTVARLAQRPGVVLNGTVDGVLARKRTQLHAQLAAGLTKLKIDLDAPFSSDARTDAPLSGHAELQDLDLGDVAMLLGLAPENHLAGLVGGTATLSGTWGQPVLSARLGLKACSVRGSPPISGLAVLDTNSRAVLTLDLRSAGAHVHGTSEVALPPDLLKHKRPLSELTTLAVQTDLTLDGLDLNTWRTPLRFPHGTLGHAQAHLVAHGTLADPRGSVDAQVLGLSYGKLTHAQLELHASADSQLTFHGELQQGTQTLAHLDGLLATSLGALRARTDAIGGVTAQAKLLLDAPELANVGVLANVAPHGAAKVNAELHGTLDAPVVHVDVQGRQVVLSGAMVGDVDAGLDYEASRARAHIKLSQLELSGEARHDFGLRAIRAGSLGDTQISAKLDADHFNLAALSGLSQAASTLAGTLNAHVQADGTLSAPTVHGNADLDNGRLVLAGLGDFHPITLRFQADDKRLSLSQLEIHAADGVATIQAEALRSSASGPFTLRGSIHSKQFPIRYEDQVMGKLDLDGSVDGSLNTKSPLIQLHIAKAQVQVPQLTHRDVQSLDPNPDIVILGRRNRRARVASAAAPGAGVSGAQQAITTAQHGPEIRLGIYAPHDVSIKGNDIDLYLQGQLGLLIEPLGDQFMQIIPPPGASGGSYLQATRGWISVIGRKFEVQHDKIARVDFLGGPPTNAMLDVAMVFDDHADQIVVTVQITGPILKPNPPTLSSQPPMEQSQLALLIATGHVQPRRGAGTVSAASGAGSLVGSVVAGAVQRAVAKSLPLDTVSVQTSAQGQISAEVGKYVTDRIYIGYSHNFTADILPGSLENQDLNINELTLQYQLTRRWHLEAIGGESMGAFNAIWQKDF